MIRASFCEDVRHILVRIEKERGWNAFPASLNEKGQMQ